MDLQSSKSWTKFSNRINVDHRVHPESLGARRETLERLGRAERLAVVATEDNGVVTLCQRLLDMLGEQVTVLNNELNVFFVQLVVSRCAVRIRCVNREVEPLDLLDIDLLELNAKLRGPLKGLEPALAFQPLWSSGCTDANLALGEGEPNDFDFLDGSHIYFLMIFRMSQSAFKEVDEPF